MKATRNRRSSAPREPGEGGASGSAAVPPASDARAPIAIIGMACIFPRAPDVRTFWNNILEGVDAIGEPVANWGAERYLAAGRIRTQRGGWLGDLYRFDPREFGIMPNSVDGGETDQYLALRVARDALADAGYLGADDVNADTGIVLGHSAYLHRGQVTVIQNNIVLDQTMDLVRLALPAMEEPALEELRALLKAKLPPTTADNAPGLVPNMMTGRIANRLNLRGPNYVLDAACASSLLALAAAADELRTGRSRMMLAGGVNATLPADVSTSFTQLGALSARGSIRPFERGNDGTLLGEGLGVVVLKRLADAVADGDRVYAVLRGIGQSSDGRGAGLLAPSQEGETLAIRRAYAGSGIDPASVDLVEAHGTGIPLGDKTEIASLRAVFGERTTPIGTKALGSVKSMISHCIPAAGIASLIKMALALHHRTLPPTLCAEVNPELGIGETPFYVNTRTAPWLARPGAPRRAAVNSFGFGGINAHAILEQAPEGAVKPGRLTAWPAELCVVSAADAGTLATRLEELAAALGRNPHWRLADVAATLAAADTGALHRIAFVAKDSAALAAAIPPALAKVRAGKPNVGAQRARAVYGNQPASGKLAFVFPGEGSQYPGMLADLALCFDEVQRWLDFWHALYDLPSGHTRTDIVFPTSEVDDEQRALLEQRLHDMDVGSEAVFIGGMAMFELLSSLGIEADAMLGHSSGESAALAASGANPAQSPRELAACIARHYAVYDALLKGDRIPFGALLAVGALPSEEVAQQVAALALDIQVAMDNCGNQLVLYGTPADIATLEEALTRRGAICMRLPFDRGYHTPAFADVSAAFLGYYEEIGVGSPKVPLWSCASVGVFPSEPAAVRELAAAQWSRTVRFRETVLAMHEDGVRLFVESGPSANLSAFINDILGGREAIAMPANVRRRNGVEQVLALLSQLYAAGRGIDLSRLFATRAVAPVDLAGTESRREPPLLDNTMPMIRLDAAERDRVRALTAVAPPPAAVPPQTPPVAVDGAGDEGATEGAREQVMAGYFDLMRDFLDQQRAFVEQLVPAAVAAGAAAVDGNAADAGVPATGGTTATAWSSHATDSRTPLLDAILEQGSGYVVARSQVSLANDRFIRDHVLSGPVSDDDPALHGLACVPFMVSLEMMAEACALLAGRFDLTAIENVSAFDWVALDEGELAIDIRADVLDAAGGRYAAQVMTPRGLAVTAEFCFGAECVLGGVPDLLERRPWGIDVPHLYTTARHGMFHGPVFQSMREIVAWDDTGIDVRLSDVAIDGFFAEGHRPRLLLNPVLLDALGQVVPCWLVQYVGPEFHSFPSTIERIELHEPCPASREGILMQARQQPSDPADNSLSAPRSWQFDCTDGEGRVLLRCRGMGNLFFRVPPSYHAVRTHPRAGMLGGPLERAPVAGVLLWQVPLIGEDLATQSGGICLRVLAHAILSADERAEWRVLEGGARRRREWLSGRAAIKEGVRHWVYERTGQLLHPADIIVWRDASNAPHVDGAWCDTLVAPPRVSLSHDEGACIAAVAAPELAVGVDFEQIGRVQQPALLADTLGEGEHALLEGLAGDALAERVLRLWCAREAASKCLGTGLQGEPWAFRIAAADSACDHLVVEHATGTVQAHVARHDDTIIAVATPALLDLEIPA
jgi:acyl transferase domain-containing protein/phosphopantetheinyl transferase (holo-ACP synthase)